MAFGDFTFPRVQQDLGLTVDEADLHSEIPGIPLREEFASTIAEGAKIALAMNTEKAKSEFIIAPDPPGIEEAARGCGRHLLGGRIQRRPGQGPRWCL